MSPFVLATLAFVLLQHPTGEGRPAHTVLPEEGQSLPFQLAGGSPVVECEIDGRGPFRMLVDTGAAVPVLDERLASELELTVLGETAIGDPSDPSAVRARRVHVDEIRLGDAAFEDMTAVSWKVSAGLLPPGVRGILGLPLFAECTCTLDYPRAELRLQKGPLPEPDGKGVLALTRDPESGLLTLPIRVADVECVACLDSGNSASLVLPAELESRLPLVPGSRKEGRGLRASGEVTFVIARLDGRVRIGSAELERPEVRFAAGSKANLGYEMLRHFAVAIDARNGRIRFESPAASDPAHPAGPK